LSSITTATAAAVTATTVTATTTVTVTVTLHISNGTQTITVDGTQTIRVDGTQTTTADDSPGCNIWFAGMIHKTGCRIDGTGQLALSHSGGTTPMFSRRLHMCYGMGIANQLANVTKQQRGYIYHVCIF